MSVLLMSLYESFSCHCWSRHCCLCVHSMSLSVLMDRVIVVVYYQHLARHVFLNRTGRNHSCSAAALNSILFSAALVCIGIRDASCMSRLNKLVRCRFPGMAASLLLQVVEKIDCLQACR